MTIWRKLLVSLVVGLGFLAALVGVSWALGHFVTGNFLDPTAVAFTSQVAAEVLCGLLAAVVTLAAGASVSAVGVYRPGTLWLQ